MKNIFKIAGCACIMAVALSACTKEDDVTPSDDPTSINGSWNVSEKQ
jgi:hypothetical protein